MAGLLRPRRGLIDDLHHFVEARGETLLVLGHPGALFEHARHGGPVEGPQPLPAADGADGLSVGSGGLLGPLHLDVEFGLDLEELTEVLIEHIQELKDLRGADEEHLHVQRNRLRPQRGGRHQAQLLADVFDPRLPALQGAFQGFPRERIRQHVADLQREEAAVGLLQCPALDHGEIGDQRAKLPTVLYLSQQVVVCGVALLDHGGAPEMAVVHDQIHPVAGEGFLPAHQGGERKRGGGFFLLFEIVEVLHHIGQDLVQVGTDLGMIGVALFQTGDGVRGRRADGPLLQLPHGVTGLALDDPDLAQDFAHFLLQRAAAAGDLVALLFREQVEQLRGNRLS